MAHRKKFRLFFVSMLLLFSSGCIIGGDSQSVAGELRQVRETFVSNGLLVPVQTTQQEKYRDALLGFRKTISEKGGLDAGVLNSYVNGSIALLEMNEKTRGGIYFLKNVNPELPECGENTLIQKAIESFQASKEKSMQAHEEFGKVKEKTEIANALGADYLLNAYKTTQAITDAHEERIQDLKTACGPV